LLTAKVFHDRDVQGFKRFTNNPSADDLLRAVSNQYREKSTGLLTKRAREVASSHIWTKLNFKNVSVDVLSQIWSNTLVDDAVRDKLGIHRTSKSIVDYIINRIAFTQQTSPGLFVLEPCCGSGAFLIGAMNALRRQLFGLTAKDRHRYFTQTLRGIEKDAFGAEISRLALTLADFPNPDGWNIRTHDVFDDPQFPEDLSKAAVVLCNPPFEDFSEEDKKSHGDRHPKKPVALLNLVLDHLHPDGVIGFVVPPTFMSGKGGYAKIRRRLGERFSKLDVTYLPDRAFEGVSTESCLLVATKPIPFGSTTVTVSRVADSHYAWHKFEHAHEVTYRYEKTIAPDNLEFGLQMPDLSELWEFLEGNDRLDKVSTAHRGIEWSKKLTSDGSETGNRNELIRTTPKPGFALGVAPKTKFGPFDIPPMSYLDMRPENQRGNAYKHAWHIPKVIISKSSRSRGGWRLTAFADMDGVVCYQTFIGLWPKGKLYDPFVLSAILNSPVANAFIATWESKTGGRLTTLDRIPIPYIDLNAARQIRGLVQKYMTIRKQDKICNDYELKTALLMIDAEVLKSYQLPPRIENELLSYYWGEARPTDFAFTGYFNPEEDEAYYSLHERMQDDFEDSTIERQLLWLSREQA
jgi:hypothetical protein